MIQVDCHLVMVSFLSAGNSAPQIVINPARRRMMERLALYHEGELDSLAVLASTPSGEGNGPTSAMLCSWRWHYSISKLVLLN